MEYTFPTPPWYKRLPGVRHIRAMAFSYRCNRHYALWRQAGFIGGWSEQEVAYWSAILEGRA